MNNIVNIIIGFVSASRDFDVFDAYRALQQIGKNLTPVEKREVMNAIDEADANGIAGDDEISNVRKILARVAKSSLKNEVTMKITKGQLIRLIREEVEFESKFEKSIKSAVAGIHAAMNMMSDDRDPVFQKLDSLAGELNRIIK